MRKQISIPWFCFILFMWFVAVASAQSPTQYRWTQDGPDLNSVQRYSYRLYLDGSASFTSALVATCSGTVAPYSCTAPLTLTAGTHTVQITAVNNIGESPKSAAITVTVSVPAAPQNVQAQ